jgi:exosome complex exonuclease DIS3/RRP44
VIHDDPKQTDQVAVGIRGLNKLAKKLRAKRMEAGALLLASAEVHHRWHSHQKLKAAQMRDWWVHHTTF